MIYEESCRKILSKHKILLILFLLKPLGKEKKNADLLCETWGFSKAWIILLLFLYFRGTCHLIFLMYVITGWNIFPLRDFLDWKHTESTYYCIEVSENIMWYSPSSLSSFTNIFLSISGKEKFTITTIS